MSTEENAATKELDKNKARNKKKAASKKTTKRFIPKVGAIAHHVYFPNAAKPAEFAFSEFIIEEVKKHPKPVAMLEEHPDAKDTVWAKTGKGWMPLNMIPLSKADAVNRVKQSLVQARPYYTKLVVDARKKLADTMQQTAQRAEVDNQRLEALNSIK